MKREATVVERDGKLVAEVVRAEACRDCHACQFGRTERVFVDLPPGDHRPGDVVELALDDGKVGIASAIAYGIPLALLFIALVVASAVGLSEIWQAASALAGLGAGLLLIRVLEPRLRRFQPRALPCKKKEE